MNIRLFHIRFVSGLKYYLDALFFFFVALHSNSSRCFICIISEITIRHKEISRSANDNNYSKKNTINTTLVVYNRYILLHCSNSTCISALSTNGIERECLGDLTMNEFPLRSSARYVLFHCCSHLIIIWHENRIVYFNEKKNILYSITIENYPSGFFCFF